LKTGKGGGDQKNREGKKRTDMKKSSASAQKNTHHRGGIRSPAKGDADQDHQMKILEAKKVLWRPEGFARNNNNKRIKDIVNLKKGPQPKKGSGKKKRHIEM